MYKIKSYVMGNAIYVQILRIAPENELKYRERHDHLLFR